MTIFRKYVHNSYILKKHRDLLEHNLFYHKITNILHINIAMNINPYYNIQVRLIWSGISEKN